MRRLARKLMRLLDGTPAEYRPTGGDKRGTREKGQSLVEMAFITPIIIILIVGIAEIGWYANNYLILLEVTRVGARRGAVLSGEFSPLVWENDATLINISARPGIDPDQLEMEVSGEGLDALAIREALRINSRNCALVANPTGAAPGEMTVGFYNLVLCQMLDSLDPLTMKTNLPPGTLEEDKVDDIIISVFAIQMIDNRAENPANPDDGGDIDFNTLYTTGNSPSITTNGAPTSNQSDAEFSGPEWEGYIPVVVGRYPTNANECNAYEAAGIMYAYQGAERDPFDYIDDNGITFRTIPTTVTGQSDRQTPVELGSRIVADDWDNGAIVGPVRALDPNTRYEAQRGWVYSGYHLLPGDEITASMYSPQLGGNINVTANGFCVGSEWSIYDVQELIRNEQFELTQGVINQMRVSDPYFGYDCTGITPLPGNPAGVCEEIDVNQFYASQGLVLVEIYWEHQLLLDLPGFNVVYNLVGGDTTEIYVWSAFPVATVSPDIKFWPSWESLATN